ncbi:hypothetical protein MPC1_1210006 [Methylocella tundrae]|nr:hypothetical protein MPC1_1210006 [Methylocella tundrae]
MRLLSGEPARKGARQLIFAWSFVEVAGKQGVGLDADLLQQLQAARRRRRQNEPWAPGWAIRKLAIRRLAMRRLVMQNLIFGGHRGESGRSCAPRPEVSPSSGIGSLEAVGDATLGQVVGRHFDEDLVARKNTNPVLAHFAGRMGDDLMLVFELNPKCRIRQQFDDDSWKFKQFFFRHLCPCI